MTTPTRSIVALLFVSVAAAACHVASGTPEPVLASPRRAPLVPHSAAAPAPASSASGGALAVVAPAAMCVTAGQLEPFGAHEHVDTGLMRAVIADDHSRSAEIDFVYHGPSRTAAPLADGELRRQIGLKLKAQDGCNVVYVMWHIEPTPTIEVAVKRNAGVSLDKVCGDHGYSFIKPTTEVKVAAPARDVPSTLRADLEGTELRVTANGNVVWRGDLPAESLAFDGPAGIRTDNGAFDFELRIPGGHSAAGACKH